MLKKSVFVMSLVALSFAMGSKLEAGRRKQNENNDPNQTLITAHFKKKEVAVEVEVPENVKRDAVAFGIYDRRKDVPDTMSKDDLTQLISNIGWASKNM
jgi:hypothetical protein